MIIYLSLLFGVSSVIRHLTNYVERKPRNFVNYHVCAVSVLERLNSHHSEKPRTVISRSSTEASYAHFSPRSAFSTETLVNPPKLQSIFRCMRIHNNETHRRPPKFLIRSTSNKTLSISRNGKRSARCSFPECSIQASYGLRVENTTAKKVSREFGFDARLDQKFCR